MSDSRQQELFILLTCFKAASEGDLEKLKQIKFSGYDWSLVTSLTDTAVKHGKLECLRYLHENGCGMERWICETAASNGQLECLRYLHKNGCEWNKSTTKAAAKHGKLECLRYLHENGCEWDEWACDIATLNGHLECLQYLYENGCPVDTDIATTAATYDQTECLRYLYKRGCSIDFNQTAHYALINNCLKPFKFCFEKCPSGQALWDSLKDSWDVCFIRELNLDDPVWRRLLFIDLSLYPQLKSKVENKKREIEKLKMFTDNLLKDKISSNIIKYCIHPYI